MGHKWIEVKSLVFCLKDYEVFIGVQAIYDVQENGVCYGARRCLHCSACSHGGQGESEHMVKFVNGLSHESIIVVQGFVFFPGETIKGTSQQKCAT
ncbi:hypothetical protein BVRB_2g039160 isoform B [Beta vulgaris subsp. vulgaris]|nr:hypothetical protein BVRB_2g039160 isoform B [Beta vulgaris subsp. vulgaris]